ncbi:hypothetical protein EG68_01626 [Paragonimus skrjabini miyazakii]|uniref:Uncharacterized protein n=1 Tax=Paragonimus skrjabini miyazakii TaxID=59628 RepID=A0A8S9ZAZ0_9TREM|nr:hypothetical protein EG68_01626 [Paragonimus skrjabini miyazakii]
MLLKRSLKHHQPCVSFSSHKLWSTAYIIMFSTRIRDHHINKQSQNDHCHSPRFNIIFATLVVCTNYSDTSVPPPNMN